MKWFFVPLSNKVCHEILGFLITKSNGINYYESVSSKEIAAKANLDISAIALFHTLLKANNEIFCEYYAEEILITLTDTGKNSFVNEKYLKDGRKEKLSNYALYLQVTIPWISLLISLVALAKSFLK